MSYPCEKKYSMNLVRHAEDEVNLYDVLNLINLDNIEPKLLYNYTNTLQNEDCINDIIERLMVVSKNVFHSNFPPGTPLRFNAGRRAASLPFGAPFIEFTNICADIHNDIHNYYGGTFGSPWSPVDPLFWVFHAFWDDVYKEYMSIHNMRRTRTMMPVRMPNL